MAGSKHDADCLRRKEDPAMLYVCTCGLTDEQVKTPNRDSKPDQSVFDRDPCDGCDGTCGDVCPVLEARRLTEREERYAAVRHAYGVEAQERGRLQAEVETLKEEQVAFVRALEKTQAERDVYKAALEEIEGSPRAGIGCDQQVIARAALNQYRSPLTSDEQRLATEDDHA